MNAEFSPKRGKYATDATPKPLEKLETAMPGGKSRKKSEDSTKNKTKQKRGSHGVVLRKCSSSKLKSEKTQPKQISLAAQHVSVLADQKRATSAHAAPKTTTKSAPIRVSSATSPRRFPVRSPPKRNASSPSLPRPPPRTRSSPTQRASIAQTPTTTKNLTDSKGKTHEVSRGISASSGHTPRMTGSPPSANRSSSAPILPWYCSWVDGGVALPQISRWKTSANGEMEMDSPIKPKRRKGGKPARDELSASCHTPRAAKLVKSEMDGSLMSCHAPRKSQPVKKDLKLASFQSQTSEVAKNNPNKVKVFTPTWEKQFPKRRGPDTHAPSAFNQQPHVIESPSRGRSSKELSPQPYATRHAQRKKSVDVLSRSCHTSNATLRLPLQSKGTRVRKTKSADLSASWHCPQVLSVSEALPMQLKLKRAACDGFSFSCHYPRVTETPRSRGRSSSKPFLPQKDKTEAESLAKESPAAGCREDIRRPTTSRKKPIVRRTSSGDSLNTNTIKKRINAGKEKKFQSSSTQTSAYLSSDTPGVTTVRRRCRSRGIKPTKSLESSDILLTPDIPTVTSNTRSRSFSPSSRRNWGKHPNMQPQKKTSRIVVVGWLDE